MSNFIVGINGRPVPTSDDGQLLVDTTPAPVYATQRGDSYVAAGAADTSAADADFFYLKNNDARDLVIFQIRGYIAGGADCGVSIKIGVTGTPGTPTAITPANMRSNGPVANVTCSQRDGDLALTGGTTVDFLFMDKDVVGEQVWDFESGIVLPHNTALVYNTDADPTGNDIATQTFFYFVEPD